MKILIDTDKEGRRSTGKFTWDDDRGVTPEYEQVIATVERDDTGNVRKYRIKVPLDYTVVEINDTFIEFTLNQYACSDMVKELARVYEERS